jgi:hypothetical protein
MSTVFTHGFGSFRSWQTRIQLGALTVVLALTASSCGGQGTVTSAIGPSSTNPYPYPYPSYPPTGTTGTGGSTGSSGGPDPFAGATQLNFSLNGTNSGNETYTSAPFTTDNLLKVRLTALPAGVNTGGGTNFSAMYNCAGFTVSIPGQSQDSQPLAVNGGVIGMCQSGSQQVFDFSSRLSPGHGPVSITVSNPKYDWYCMLFTYYPWLMGGTATMYCPLHPVYQYHTVQGMIEVLTNNSGT